MAICPVCGCKTDDLDFISRVVGAEEEKVCSFCDRQLKNFEGAGEPTEAQLRWLDAVIQKEVPARSAGVLTALKAMNGKYQKAEVQGQPPQGNTAAQKAQPVHQRQVPAQASPVSGSRDEQIEELTKRVAALEAELKSMKRKQMIKTIVELGAPVVMLILLIIVFFASGLYDSLQALMGIDGLAEMMGL